MNNQTTKTKWPPSESFLKSLLKENESRLLDFKQSWYDLSKNSQKAEFLKDILAFANAAEPNETAFLIIGVEDKKGKRSIKGIGDEFIPDQASQVIDRYTSPVPEIKFHTWTYEGKKIGIVGVLGTALRPYYAIRKIGSVSRNIAYTRRNAVNSQLTMVEVEYLIRKKQAELGELKDQEPFKFGLVDPGNWNGPNGPILRIENISGDQISSISVVFDAVCRPKPHLFNRTERMTNAKLNPEESIEIEYKLEHLMFIESDNEVIKPKENTDRRFKQVDITAIITFRKRDGYFDTVKYTWHMSG